MGKEYYYGHEAQILHKIITYKLCQILEYDEFLPKFKLFKGRGAAP